jgi:AcrR family transcriptional regulator
VSAIEGGNEAAGPRRFADASRLLLRTTVFGAMDDLAADRPWAAITMAEIARAAGVSRQTLYNEFGTRDELAQAYVLWASEQFLDEIERVVGARPDDLGGALQDAFRVFLELAAEHPLVRALEAATGAEGLHALVASSAGLPILLTSTERLTEFVLGNWPELPVTDTRLVCELLVRLAISHATVPTVPPAVAAEQVSTVLGPFLVEVRAALPH